MEPIASRSTIGCSPINFTDLEELFLNIRDPDSHTKHYFHSFLKSVVSPRLQRLFVNIQGRAAVVGWFPFLDEELNGFVERQEGYGKLSIKIAVRVDEKGIRDLFPLVTRHGVLEVRNIGFRGYQVRVLLRIPVAS